MKTMTHQHLTNPITTGAWQLVAPVVALRSEGGVCPAYVADRSQGRDRGLGSIAAADERTFAGTRAWSPPDR